MYIIAFVDLLFVRYFYNVFFSLMAMCMEMKKFIRKKKQKKKQKLVYRNNRPPYICNGITQHDRIDYS